MEKKNNNSGIGCGGLLAVLLTVAFVVLKLCNVIAWSWWWVLSPLWIYAVLAIVIFVLVLIISIFSD